MICLQTLKKNEYVSSPISLALLGTVEGGTGEPAQSSMGSHPSLYADVRH